MTRRNNETAAEFRRRQAEAKRAWRLNHSDARTDRVRKLERLRKRAWRLQNQAHERELERERYRLRRGGYVDRRWKHGHAPGGRSTPTHSSWLAMKARCSNPSHHSYSRYGGRGIRVCKRWLGTHGFTNFLTDMGVRPKGKTLDRINPNGNYEPSNCRWATPSEQSQNQRKRTRSGSA